MPVEQCEEANKLLRERFETERPAFRVDVQSAIEHGLKWNGRIFYSYRSKEFPAMYNDLLTSFHSQVALFPYDCNTFLQRNVQILILNVFFLCISEVLRRLNITLYEFSEEGKK